MIESIEVTAGYAASLPAIKGKRFVFTPGLNILFGPNGCGKSSLLNIMAGYTLSKEGGWSSYFHDGFPTFKTEGSGFPDSIVVNGCKANVAWDGTATYFRSTTVSDQPINVFGVTGMDFNEEVIEIVSKPSDGQKRLFRLNQVFKELSDPKPLDLTVTGRGEAIVEYIKTLSRKGPFTVLLDEPDRSLSLENQALIWAGFPNMARKLQVIIATQSLFPVLRVPDGVNLIDVESGYLAHSKMILSMYTEGKTHAEIAKVAQKLREAEAEKVEIKKPKRSKSRKVNK